MAKLTKKQLSAAAKAMPRDKKTGRIKKKAQWTSADKAKVSKCCGK